MKSLKPCCAEPPRRFERETCSTLFLAVTENRGGILGERHKEPSRSGRPKKCLSAMTSSSHIGMMELSLAANSSDGRR